MQKCVDGWHTLLSMRASTGTSAKRERRNEKTNWAEWGCRWTHSASGTVTQGKQCSGSHLVKTGVGDGGAEEGGRGSGWRKGLQRAQAYGKADFSSPCSSQGRQMSACAVSTLDCAALGTTTWPSLLSHRVWAAVTLWNFSPGWRKASPCSGSSTCTHVHQHLLHPLLFFTQEIHKETLALFTFIQPCYSSLKRKHELDWNHYRSICIVLICFELQQGKHQTSWENPNSTQKPDSLKKLFYTKICYCLAYIQVHQILHSNILPHRKSWQKG